MSWPDIVRGVQERIHDSAAQDRELAALAQEELLLGCRHTEALDAIYKIATRALSEPSDTSALIEICDIVESVLNP